MPVSDQELSTLAASHDIISIGMLADEARRERHGLRTTFVRVRDVDAAPGAPIPPASAAGEIRIAGAPPTLAGAVARVREVTAAASNVPVSAFSLADLELLAAREHVTLRALLEELQSAGLELVAEAPFDRLRDPRRSIEEVNIAGLALARLTLYQWPSADVLATLKHIAALQREIGVLRAFAPLPRALSPVQPTTSRRPVTTM
jgi:hypothetical protein